MFNAIAAVLYLLFVIPLFVFASRRGIESAWLAFVPLANWAILGAIWEDVDEPRWGRGIVLLLLALIPLVALLELGALWARAAVRTGQNRWLGLLCVIPPLTFVLPWVIALRAQRRARLAFA